MAANGQLDPNTLRVLPGFAPYGAHDNFLPASTTTLSNLGTPAMAADYINMRAAFPAEFGILTYAEAYRSLTMQQQRWREHLAGGPLAASPGTSNHGTARAMDFRNNVGTYGSPAHQWFVNNASRFGFTPISSEGWHWEHLSDTVTSHTATTATASSGATTLIPKEPEMAKEDIDNAKAALFLSTHPAKAALFAKQIDGVYRNRLGRPVDESGLSGALRGMALGLSITWVDLKVMQSLEYKKRQAKKK